MHPLLLLALTPATLVSAGAAIPKSAIFLSDVKTLTLRGNGATTTNRRVPSIPQLKCISSQAICDLYNLEVMSCTNQGSSYEQEDIEWSCKATLPEELKLGSTNVICEGYASADDSYILKGSCGVEYVLALTEEGEAKYAHIFNPPSRLFSDGEGGTDWSAWAFTVIFLSVLGWIVYSAFFAGGATGGAARPTQAQQQLQKHQQQQQQQQQQPQPQRRRRVDGNASRRGGGRQPGWAPGTDSSSPYTDHSQPYSDYNQQYSDYSQPYSDYSQPYSDYREARGPGFWSAVAGGAAAGTAAGYMAGSRSRNDGYQRGWGAAGPPPSMRDSPASSAGSSVGSARHESTGFGSTRRR